MRGGKGTVRNRHRKRHRMRRRDANSPRCSMLNQHTVWSNNHLRLLPWTHLQPTWDFSKHIKQLLLFHHLVKCLLCVLFKCIRVDVLFHQTRSTGKIYTEFDFIISINSFLFLCVCVLVCEEQGGSCLSFGSVKDFPLPFWLYVTNTIFWFLREIHFPTSSFMEDFASTSGFVWCLCFLL